MAVEIGDTAPDFELPDQHGTPVKLSSFRGVKNVVRGVLPAGIQPRLQWRAVRHAGGLPRGQRRRRGTAHDLRGLPLRAQDLGGAGELRVLPAGRLLAARRGRPGLRRLRRRPRPGRSGAPSSSTRRASCAGRSSTRSPRPATSPTTRRPSPNSRSWALGLAPQVQMILVCMGCGAAVVLPAQFGPHHSAAPHALGAHRSCGSVPRFRRCSAGVRHAWLAGRL